MSHACSTLVYSTRQYFFVVLLRVPGEDENASYCIVPRLLNWGAHICTSAARGFLEFLGILQYRRTRRRELRIYKNLLSTVIT